MQYHYHPLFTCILMLGYSEQNILLKNLGKIQFSQQEYEIQINLEIDKFYQISNLIIECKNELLETCNKFDNPNCMDNTGLIDYIQNYTTKNINKIRYLNRIKRFEPISLIVVGGITVMSAISAYAMHVRTLKQMKTALKTENELLQSSMATIRNEMDIHKDMMTDIENLMRDFSQNITMNMNNNNKLTFIILNLILIMHEHDNYYNKIKEFYLGNLEESFFSIIDLEDLTKCIEKINNNELNPNNLRIPEIKSKADIKFIKIEPKTNINHTYISLKLPILYGETYDLYDLIPIPTTINNELNILNINYTKFIRVNDEIHILNLDAFSFLCNNTDTMTICNSILNTSTTPNKCLKHLIINNDDKYCFYKPIEPKPYFIRISDDKLFIYTNKPIKINVACKNSFHNEADLIESTEIIFSKSCSSHKIIPEYYYKDKTKIKLNTSISIFYPKISMQDIQLNKWISNVTIIEKNEIHLIKLREKFQKIQTQLVENAKRIDEIDTSNIFTKIWNYVANFISESLTKIIIYAIIFIIIFILSILLIWKLIGIIF